MKLHASTKIQNECTVADNNQMCCTHSTHNPRVFESIFSMYCLYCKHTSSYYILQSYLIRNVCIFYNTCDICLAFESMSTSSSCRAYMNRISRLYRNSNLRIRIPLFKKTPSSWIPIDIYVLWLLFQIGVTPRMLFRCHLDSGTRFNFHKDYCGNLPPLAFFFLDGVEKNARPSVKPPGRLTRPLHVMLWQWGVGANEGPAARVRVDRVRAHFDADQIRSVRAFVCELFACFRRCLCDLTCLFSVFYTACHNTSLEACLSWFCARTSIISQKSGRQQTASRVH